MSVTVLCCAGWEEMEIPSLAYSLSEEKDQIQSPQKPTGVRTWRRTESSESLGLGPELISLLKKVALCEQQGPKAGKGVAMKCYHDTRQTKV